MAQAPAQSVATGGSRWLLWALIGIIVLFFGIPLLVLGWLGFVPGLSALLGADEPKHLGVQYSAADVQSFQAKSGITFRDAVPAPESPAVPEKKSLVANPQRVETSFTQEELSAALNGASLPWLPLKDVQVKLSDRMIELSGLFSTDRIPDLTRLASGSGYSASDIARIVGYAEKLGADVPVYVKASGAVEQAQLNLQLQKVTVGRFNVPPDVVARLAPNGIHKVIKGSDSFAIEQATPKEGTLSFTGILPATIDPNKD